MAIFNSYVSLPEGTPHFIGEKTRSSAFHRRMALVEVAFHGLHALSWEELWRRFPLDRVTTWNIQIDLYIYILRYIYIYMIYVYWYIYIYVYYICIKTPLKAFSLVAFSDQSFYKSLRDHPTTGLVLEAMNWKISMGTSPSRSSFVEHCAVVAWTALHLRQVTLNVVCSSHVDKMWPYLIYNIYI